VDLVRYRGTGELRHRREDVPHGPDLVALRARRDAPRTPGDHRHANPPLVEVPLAPAEGARAREEVRVGTALHAGTVVAGEEHDGVLGQSVFPQTVEDAADIAVHA